MYIVRSIVELKRSAHCLGKKPLTKKQWHFLVPFDKFESRCDCLLQLSGIFLRRVSDVRSTYLVLTMDDKYISRER